MTIKPAYNFLVRAGIYAISIAFTISVTLVSLRAFTQSLLQDSVTKNYLMDSAAQINTERTVPTSFDKLSKEKKIILSFFPLSCQHHNSSLNISECRNLYEVIL